jgi:hypothetical protein
MENYRLIQRLLIPKTLPKEGYINEIRNGYLKKEKFESHLIPEINDFFRLDYMGSAEYEFGAFRKGMEALMELEGTWSTLSLSGKPASNFSSKPIKDVNPDLIFTGEAPTQTTELYLYTAEKEKDFLTKYIQACTENPSNERDLKERAQFQEGIFGRVTRVTNNRKTLYHPERYILEKEGIFTPTSWLELEGRFFATTNLETAQSMAILTQKELL